MAAPPKLSVTSLTERLVFLQGCVKTSPLKPRLRLSWRLDFCSRSLPCPLCPSFWGASSVFSAAEVSSEGLFLLSVPFFPIGQRTMHGSGRLLQSRGGAGRQICWVRSEQGGDPSPKLCSQVWP